MATPHEKAVARLLEELELKAVQMRLAVKKFDRDLAILETFLASKSGSALSPHIRRRINQRLQARTDAQIAVHELMQSQEFYLLQRRATP